MDLKRLSLGEQIAAVSGAALFLFLFPPWFEGDNAWGLFRVVSIVLAVLALVSVALPLFKAVGAELSLGISNRDALVRAGSVALIAVLAYLVEALGSAQVGIFLAALAAAGILYGGVTTPEEAAEGARARRGRERPRRASSSEEFEEPPPGMEDWRPGARSWGPEEFEEEPGSTRAGRASPARREREADLEPEEPEPRRGRARAEGEPTEVRDSRRRGEPGPPEAS